MRIILRVAIDPPEGKEVEEADESGDGEAPAPANFEEQDADKRNADCGGELGGAIEDRCGKAALVRRKPIADRLGIRGKRGRFAYAEQEPCSEKAADAGRYCRGEGSNTPQESANAADALNSEFVQQDADWKLAYRIGPVVCPRQVAKRDGRNAEGGDESRMRDGEIDPVEIVDQNAEAQKPCDAPSASWHRVLPSRIHDNEGPRSGNDLYTGA